jgi:hypothetical protein
MSHAVACKDHLLSLINDADDIHKLVEVSQVITTILTHTEGLWLEAGYCYKASEIATRCANELASYCGACMHHKTHEMVDKHRSALRSIAERYYQLQQQSFEEQRTLGELVSEKTQKLVESFSD